jgi:GTP pyrophosphokinase
MAMDVVQRQIDPIHPTIDDLRDTMARYLADDGVEAVMTAYEFAAEAHRDHQRASGDPFIEHPLAAAISCAELQLDVPVLQAALLHDVVEDCDVDSEEIAKNFGDEVAKLVDGVTKLGSLALPSVSPASAADEVQAENLRKMFIAMAEDVRVVIVKLSDRLHNMRTLSALPMEKQRRIASETMEIYAPLAARLGIWQLKWELEDLAFRHLEPDEYHKIAEQVAARRATRERYVMQLRRKLEDALAANNIRAEVTGRAKHIYSIHQKINKYAAIGKSFDEIYDLLALRVLVDKTEDCYNALGVVHSLWRPIPGEFDDYIGNQKPSGYRSLHTTVYWTATRPLEVQIRSFEMDAEAEYGVAAHWRYKERSSWSAAQDRERLSWLKQLLEWQGENPGAQEFVETLKSDVFQDQVFVSTPTGEIKDLPADATPLDFAFRIHTDVGYSCVGSKVNGRLVALTTPLKNGDVVEIVTSRASRGPSRDWLNPSLGYLKTNHGRTKVRQWFRKRERTENIARGREELEKELRRLSLRLNDAEEALLEMAGFAELDDLLAAIGSGELTAHQMALRLASMVVADEIPEAPQIGGVAVPRDRMATGVHVLGASNILTRFANCCSPLPGDFIMGYVTRSRGVTVHRHDCHNVLHTPERERLVDVQWGSAPGTRYPALIRIEGWDRVGFVRDISTVIADEDVNMVGLRTEESGDGRVVVGVTVESDGLAHLQRVMHKLDTIRGVLTVDREN